MEWLPLDEIIKKNEEIQDMEAIPWVAREIKVMRQLLEDEDTLSFV